jgi:hypothetical protein
MNATTALLCGLAATLLLALGLARAAERFDPIMQGPPGNSSAILTAESCLPCMSCIDPDSSSKIA